MAALIRAFKNIAPSKNIVNVNSVAAFSHAAAIGGAVPGNLKVIPSPALTAGVLSTVLNLTGGGHIQWLQAVLVDITSRTSRYVITVDGNVVFDFTSAAAASAGGGVVLITDRLQFNSTFKLEMASSLTETAKVNFSTLYAN